MRKTPDPEFFIRVRGFLTVYLPRQKGYSHHTVKAYRDSINLLREFLQNEKQIPFMDIRFELFDHVLIGEFLSWLESVRHCRASTRNHRLAALKSFLHYAAIEDPALMTTYGELQKVHVTKSPPVPVNYLSELALKALFAQPDTETERGVRDRFLLILLYDTAARIQELLDIRLRDLTWSGTTPCVNLTGKGRKTRVAPLLSKTVDHLMFYLDRFHPESTREDHHHLFYTVIHGRAGRMSEDTAGHWIKKYGEAARTVCPEVPERVYPHLLRHTRAMHLYQAGIPLSYIKDFLGHSQIHTTDRYAFADTKMMRDALEKVTQSDRDTTGQHPVWDGNEALILKLCGLS